VTTVRSVGFVAFKQQADSASDECRSDAVHEDPERGWILLVRVATVRRSVEMACHFGPAVVSR
jgi:hypothetical protein